MSADKRSVTTDALETLGTIIDENQKRDAIHVAVEPVKAACTLRAGEHVGKGVFGTYGPVAHPIGIVDPFLKDVVREGEWFWLLVYPRQITSLRHVWSHPNFSENVESEKPVSDKEASEAWLRKFCETADCPEYADLIAAAQGINICAEEDEAGWPGYWSIRNDGEYLYFGGRDAHGNIPPEFWDHVSIVAGKEIPQEKRAKYFSCSC